MQFGENSMIQWDSNSSAVVRMCWDHRREFLFRPGENQYSIITSLLSYKYKFHCVEIAQF